MREANNDLNFYRKLMRHEVTVDRNKTAPKCRQCCYYRNKYPYAYEDLHEDGKRPFHESSLWIC